MNNEILSILEQITETCKLLCDEIYSSLDYYNSSFEMYADKFIEIQNKIFELQEECKINKNDIGKLALVGDVWYEILDIREYRNGDCFYKLYTKGQWIPKAWIRQIK